MKKITICLICGKPVRKSLAYMAETEYLKTAFLTGEQQIEKTAGWICPQCNQEAGYKTSAKKLKKYGKE